MAIFLLHVPDRLYSEKATVMAVSKVLIPPDADYGRLYTNNAILWVLYKNKLFFVTVCFATLAEEIEELKGSPDFFYCRPPRRLGSFVRNRD